MNSVQLVVDGRLCCLCGTCVPACPHGAVSLSYRDGYSVSVDGDRCVSCGKCLAVCPGRRMEACERQGGDVRDNYYLGPYRKLFSAHVADYLKRFRASSGGVLTETVNHLLAKNTVDAAVLTRFSADDPLRPEGFVAVTKEKVLEGRGSKYSPVPLNTVLGGLDWSKKYAYVGLPCHIQGVRNFIREERPEASENFIFLGLFCSRTNALGATRQLLRKSRVPEKEVAGISYRGQGHPGHFTVRLRSGGLKRVWHLADAYWGLVFKRYFVQYRCWLCPDKCAAHADLSFCDDWSRPLPEDKVGTSNVIVRSERGAALMRDMTAAGTVEASETTEDALVSSQGLAYKMNILKRAGIARMFGGRVPEYAGYAFRPERISASAEALMYLRIRLQDSWVMTAALNFDYYVLSRCAHVYRSATAAVSGRRYRILRRNLGFFRKTARRDAKRLLKGLFAGKRARGRYHIVTVGGYGYNDVGDEAQPHAQLDNLRDKFGGQLRITMLSPFPRFTAQYHGCDSVPDLKLFSARDNIMGLNTEREQYLEWAALYRKSRFRAFVSLMLDVRPDFYRLLRLVDGCDALFNAGGGNINSIMRTELYKRTIMHQVAHILGKKVYVSGQKIGPFYDDNDRFVAAEALRVCTVLTFRDKDNSLPLVRSILEDPPLMYEAGDDALSLRYINQEEAWDLIRKDSSPEWFGLEVEHVWGVNLKAALSIYKGKGRSSDLSREVALTVETVEYILNNYDAKVQLISTDYCSGVDDRVVLQEVYDGLTPALRPKVNLLHEIYNDYQLKGIISTCDFVIGARYHFVVFAVSRMVPAIGMASGEYQQTKLEGILKLLGLEKYYVTRDMEHASAEDVTELIDDLSRNREGIIRQLNNEVPALMERSVGITEHIRNALTGRDGADSGGSV